MRLSDLFYALMPFALLAVFTSCDDVVEDIPSETVCRTIKYDYGLELDFWSNIKLPANENLPVVIFVHGGGWNSGDKLDWTRKMAESLICNGIASASINYRLAPEFCIKDMLEDIDKAIDWIVNNYNTNRIFLCGHSAGAHLVSLYGVLNKSKIAGFIAIDGGEYMIYEPKDMDCSTAYYGNLKTLFNSAVGKHPAKEFVPINHVRINSVPPSLVIYQKDEPYRKNANEKFHEALISAGNVSYNLPVPDVNHSTILSQLESYIAPCNIEISKFIMSH